jgi:hypothetical protein
MPVAFPSAVRTPLWEAFFAILCLLALTLCSISPRAQSGSPPRETLADELIGAMVVVPDGTRVGEVSAVSIGSGEEITEIRMTTASPLGLGNRTVILPPGSFMVLRGAVVLDLSAAEVDALPSVAGPKDGRSQLVPGWHTEA